MVGLLHGWRILFWLSKQNLLLRVICSGFELNRSLNQEAAMYFTTGFRECQWKHFWISTSSTWKYYLFTILLNLITVTWTFAHVNKLFFSALQPLLTGPHDRNRQLNCSCPVTCGSYIWRSDIRVRNVNLVQTERRFIAGAKRHSMKGFLSSQHALHFHLTLSCIPDWQHQWFGFLGGHIQA